MLNKEYLSIYLALRWVNRSTVVGGIHVGSRAGRAQVQGAAQSYRAFLRSEGGLLRELKECRHDTSKVHLVCNNYGESSSSCLLSVGTLMKVTFEI